MSHSYLDVARQIDSNDFLFVEGGILLTVGVVSVHSVCGILANDTMSAVHQSLSIQ